MDRQQAEAISRVLLESGRKRQQSIIDRRARRASRLVAARRRAMWGLVGAGVGALIGYYAVGGAVLLAVFGFSVTQAAGLLIELLRPQRR